MAASSDATGRSEYMERVMSMAYVGDIPQCKECKTNKNMVEDAHNGNFLCTNCGIVGPRLLDTGEEYRTFDDKKGDDPSRIGRQMNALLGDMELTTGLSGEIGGGSEALRKWHSKGMHTALERSIMEGFRETTRLGQRLNLPPHVITRAQEVLKRVLESKQFHARRREVIIATCVFVACRQAGQPLLVAEVANVAGCEKKELTRSYSKIVRLKLHKSGKSKKKMGNGHASDFVERFCGNIDGLHMPHRLHISDAARHIADQARKKSIAIGRQPATNAGAAIYMAAQLHPEGKNIVTLAKLAEVTSMAPATLRQAFRDMYEHRILLVPKDYATPEDIAQMSATAST